jgi:hypothetical protein
MRGHWKAVAYWIVTGTFAALMLSSAAISLAGTVQIRDTMARLGYPPYILLILGPAKLLGVVALCGSSVWRSDCPAPALTSALSVVRISV